VDSEFAFIGVDSRLFMGLASCASESDRKRLEQFVNSAVAVGKRVEVDADFVEERQVEVGERSRLVILDVTPALHPACRAADDKDRQVRVVMDVGIADAAAVKVKRLVQQRAV